MGSEAADEVRGWGMVGGGQGVDRAVVSDYSTVQGHCTVGYSVAGITCFVKSARHQARSGPARAYDAVAGANPWPLDARIRNHGL